MRLHQWFFQLFHNKIIQKEAQENPPRNSNSYSKQFYRLPLNIFYRQDFSKVSPETPRVLPEALRGIAWSFPKRFLEVFLQELLEYCFRKFLMELHQKFFLMFKFLLGKWKGSVLISVRTLNIFPEFLRHFYLLKIFKFFSKCFPNSVFLTSSKECENKSIVGKFVNSKYVSIICEAIAKEHFTVLESNVSRGEI